MKKSVIRKEAEKLTLESITNNIVWSIEFYEKEVEKEKTVGNDFMAEHCQEMLNAYSTIKFMLDHFKF